MDGWTDASGWQQAMLTCAGRRGLTPTVAARLAAGLDGAGHVITGYHFLRKDGGLRLRVAPDDDQARRALEEILDSLAADGHIADWVRGIYEPEVHAFGGPAAMDVAHRLFCADSRASLISAGRADHASGSRVAATLLVSTLLRAASLDWFEQGDVWAKVAGQRPAPVLPSAARLAQALRSMHRLLTADAAGTLIEPGWGERVAAFETAGRDLARLTRAGQLRRGLRAVLAHHVIFTLNRAGVTRAQQSALAYLAKEVTLAHPAASDPGPGTQARKLGAMDATITSAAATREAACLRAQLTDQLRASGAITSQPIAEAFATVPRHMFVPDVPLARAYANEAIFTKYTAEGVAISAISEPTVVAAMLEQLDARPGHIVMEAGAASGYNAALIGHLVGDRGHVTTIDVDMDLVDGAREHLSNAGADNVTVLLADGALGCPDGAPFDRIIATVGAGDVPATWLDQLGPGGRLVVPLRVRGGVSRSFAFERDATSWRAISSEMCTFMPLRGVAGDTRRVVPLTPDGGVSLHVYREQHANAAALANALEQPPAEVFTGILFRKGDPWEWLFLWLTSALPCGLVRMPSSGSAVESGQVRLQFPWGSMAAVDGDSVAYLTMRAGHDDAGQYWEAGVMGHGPSGRELAGQAAEEIRAWGRGYRDLRPTVRLAQNAEREHLTGQFIIDKALSRLAITWQ